ncbi:MAG: hypothetical protein QNJ97_02400 [Myxococcota bacterium]|nr:hypothetical protein [Myxococcota bacterium]
MKKKITFLVVAMLLAAGTVSADEKFYTGAECMFAYPDSNTSLDRSAHRFKNKSGQAEWIFCPVVRDTNNTMKEAHIVLDSYNSSSPKIWYRSETGTSTYSWTYNSTTSLGNGYKRYNWTTDRSMGTDAGVAFSFPLDANKIVYTYRFEE